MTAQEDVWPEADPPADDHADSPAQPQTPDAGPLPRGSAAAAGESALAAQSAGQAAERAARLKKSPSAFRTISEVADELHVPQHVLRFWETRFPQVKPLKRGGGRRYYRPDDVDLLRRIADLLYVRGYTIKGVQRVLAEGEGAREAGPPAASSRAAGEVAWREPAHGDGGSAALLQGAPDPGTGAAPSRPAERGMADAASPEAAAPGPAPSDPALTHAASPHAAPPASAESAGEQTKPALAGAPPASPRPGGTVGRIADQTVLREMCREILSELEAMRRLLPT